MKSDHANDIPARVARLLRALAALVEKSSPEDVAALLSGQITLSRVPPYKGERAVEFELTATVPSDLSGLADKLHSLSTRDDGFSFLSASSLTRRDLEKLGRIVGIPILKTDNRERLIQKIIEASIGARLSSEAIRGDRAKSTEK